ncbi:juvenile hormone epoxide hydrolase-like [Trichoplusia ni]|uniref:Epoxide hydrolase n=1 Tax=Trichoplusia ni TaxID=7111 RepID=A0A7E5W0G2_TRINI|nr:juvenile hormone epoxide hydrolase-like [Trichoplusia ni]XP_026734018.1 juvenile hormone epoxide hydrolase-like [Trichoplusia ni]
MKFLLLTSVLIAISLRIFYNYLTSVPERPKIDPQRWWGSGSKPAKEDESIRPFKIDFNDTMIQDLKQRLINRRRFTKPLEGIQSEYGMNTDYLNKVLTYWVEKYDFKKRAELLNKFPHYKTRIQGLDLHYIRVTPKVNKNIKVLPLLMLHGWPSSSKEFVKVIPTLTTPQDGYDFVFEVIAADLPGFGFSEGTNKPGLNPVQIGVMMRNLMLRLGFKQFYVQAGDWGSQCSTHMVTLFPENVLGYHINMAGSIRRISIVKLLLGSLFPTWIDSDHPERVYPLTKYFTYVLRESGYFHLQFTKPDTIGVALTDSPAGLAGYLMEKMAIVSNRDQMDTPHGGLESLDLDDVLDTITIIWVNECIVTSTRLYSEGFRWAEDYALQDTPTEVPTAAVKFLHEVVYHPDWILRDKFVNLVRSKSYDIGGHFAALHTPKEFAEDLFAAGAAFLNFHSQKK